MGSGGGSIVIALLVIDGVGVLRDRIEDWFGPELFGKTELEPFVVVDGFKKVICETREDLFVRHLIGEILSYSTGRLMGVADDFVIDDIHERAKKDKLGLRTVLVECLTSDIFRRK